MYVYVLIYECNRLKNRAIKNDHLLLPLGQYCLNHTHTQLRVERQDEIVTADGPFRDRANLGLAVSIRPLAMGPKMVFFRRVCANCSISTKWSTLAITSIDCV